MPSRPVRYRGKDATLNWADENASAWSIKINNETVISGKGVATMLAALDDHTNLDDDLDNLENALDKKEEAEKALKQAIKEKASAGRRRKTRRRRHQRKTRRSRK